MSAYGTPRTLRAFFSPRLCLALLRASATPLRDPAAFWSSLSVEEAAFMSASSSSLSLTLLAESTRDGEERGRVIPVDVCVCNGYILPSSSTGSSVDVRGLVGIKHTR